MTMGRPFDAQEELRIGGRASAIRVLLDIATSAKHKTSEDLASQALRHIGLRIGMNQGSPECPEAWLDGMHDIEQALRYAIDSITGRPPEP